MHPLTLDSHSRRADRRYILHVDGSWTEVHGFSAALPFGNQIQHFAVTARCAGVINFVIGAAEPLTEFLLDRCRSVPHQCGTARSRQLLPVRITIALCCLGRDIKLLCLIRHFMSFETRLKRSRANAMVTRGHLSTWQGSRAFAPD
ncbi:hypothetical protein D3C71_1396330 [compost metagenome]